MKSLNKGWLYGILVMLSQTCNPNFQPPPSPTIQFEDFSNEYIKDEDNVLQEEEIPLEEEVIIIQDVEEEPAEEQIFKIEEDLPYFPSCDRQLDKEELKKCSEEELQKFIYDNLKYPDEARKKGIEGEALIEYIVEKDGSIRNVKILSEPGGGCGEEAKRVIESMPRWMFPGGSRRRVFKIKLQATVIFEL